VSGPIATIDPTTPRIPAELWRHSGRPVSAWAVRGELSRPFGMPIGTGGVTFVPYVFAAAGERILLNATALEIGSVHATNAGAGMRFSLAPWAELMPDGYGFVEWSRRKTNDETLNGDRVFTGILLRY